MKIKNVIPRIVPNISALIRKRAIRGYNDEMKVLVNDFLGKTPVPQYNLKKAYDNLIKQYSFQLALKKINILNLLKLKLFGIKTEKLAHVARLTPVEQKTFIKNLKKYGTDIMLKMAIFKNNSNVFIFEALKNSETQKIIEKSGVDIKKLQDFLLTHRKKDLNLNIIDRPILGLPSETYSTIGTKLVKRIVENVQKNPEKAHPELKKCLDEKIFQKKYSFPEFKGKSYAWYDVHGEPVLPIDTFYDVIPREKIIPLVERQVKKGLL